MIIMDFEEKKDAMGFVGKLVGSGKGDPKFYLTNEFVIKNLGALQLASSEEIIEQLQRKLVFYVNEKDFEDPYAHFGIGFGYNQLRKYEGSLIHYEYAIEYGGDDWMLSPGAYQGAANALFLQEKDFKTALKYLDKAIYLNDSFAHPWISKGLFYMNLAGEYSSAKRCFERALAIDENLISVYVELAKANFYSKNEAEGFKTLEWARNLARISPALGKFMYERKNSSAFEKLEELIEDIQIEWQKPKNGIFGLTVDERRNLMKNGIGNLYDELKNMNKNIF
jgi:tetratricopeptide (TPR) repeat protein